MKEFQNKTGLKICPTPEMELLLALSSPYFADFTDETVISLTKKCDESILFQKARFHNLLLLLKRRLSKAAFSSFSKAFATKLEQAERYTSFTNLKMTGELIKLLEAANEQEVTLIPFKGPTLAQRLYGDINLRASADLDIATNPEQVGQAINMLKGRGYQISPELNSHQLTKYISFEHFISCFHPETKIKIDLHWDFTNKYANQPFLCSNAKDHLSPLRIGAQEIMVLNNEACLVQLCIHAASHCWEHLEFTTAIAHLLTSNSLNVAKVFELAETLHAKGMVLLGLDLSSQLYNIELQKDFHSYFQDKPQIRALTNQLCQTLVSENSGHPSLPLLTWRYSSLHIKLRDSLIDKGGYLIRLLFRPTIKEYEVFPKLASSPGLYYCLRPPRLIWETIKKNRANFEETTR